MMSNIIRFLALACAVAVALADLPVLEFSANLLLSYKDSSNAANYDAEACKTGPCENVINTLLQPWQAWAMNQSGHAERDYTCNAFDDYADCPYYPAFVGHNVLRYCSYCQFTDEAYDGVDDVADLVNTTTLKWTQTFTIDGMRKVMDAIDENNNDCPCLGLKYKGLVDYYMSETGQRRRNRRYMRV